MENEWALTASTELDNGVGVAYKQSVGQGMAANDSKLMFTLVGLGTIGFDSTGTPMDAIDDKTPSAFEEATHGTGTLNDIGQNDGTMGIRYTLADVMGSGITVDTGGNSGNSYEIVASGNPLSTAGIDGVTIRVGTAQTENLRSAGEHDLTEYAAGIDYAYGPVTIGYQKNHRDLGGITTGGAETDTTNTHYSIAYAVNDSLSVSYGEAKSVERYAGDTSVEQEWDGISAGYSMGGMTVSFITGEAKNADYTV